MFYEILSIINLLDEALAEVLMKEVRRYCVELELFYLNLLPQSR